MLAAGRVWGVLDWVLTKSLKPKWIVKASTIPTRMKTISFDSHRSVARGTSEAGVASVSSGSYQEALNYEPTRDHVASVETLFGATSVAKFVYAVDNLGRRTSQLETGSVFSRYSAGGLYQTWGYNDRSEVINAQAYNTVTAGDTSSPVLGRRHDYVFDNIGNRTSSGTDQRMTTASHNALNQITSRNVLGYVDITGWAPTAATVTINSQNVTSGERQGQYYRKEVTVTPTSGPAWLGVTATSNLGGSFTRGLLIPGSPEAYTYDNDGNVLGAVPAPPLLGDRYPGMNGITRPRLHRIFQDAVGESGAEVKLARQERAVLEAVDGERSVREIIAASHLSSFDACRILFQLLEARLVRRRAA